MGFDDHQQDALRAETKNLRKFPKAMDAKPETAADPVEDNGDAQPKRRGWWARATGG